MPETSYVTFVYRLTTFPPAINSKRLEVINYDGVSASQDFDALLGRSRTSPRGIGDGGARSVRVVESKG